MAFEFRRDSTERVLQEEIKEGRINPDHMNGIMSELAVVILLYRDQNRNFPSTLIVGRHGNNLLKKVTIEFLTQHNYLHRMSQDNGSIIQIQKPCGRDTGRDQVRLPLR